MAVALVGARLVDVETVVVVVRPGLAWIGTCNQVSRESVHAAITVLSTAEM
jgi:hypothetical protein